MVLNVIHLNTRCKLSTYPSRLIPEILAKKRGAALIAKLDGRVAYHQLQVSDDDSRFLGFELANKTYRFKRLPFGVKFAPGDFQRWIETEPVGNLPSTHAYLDDFFFLLFWTMDVLIFTYAEESGRHSKNVGCENLSNCTDMKNNSGLEPVRRRRPGRASTDPLAKAG